MKETFMVTRPVYEKLQAALGETAIEKIAFGDDELTCVRVDVGEVELRFVPVKSGS